MWGNGENVSSFDVLVTHKENTGLYARDRISGEVATSAEGTLGVLFQGINNNMLHLA